MSKEDRWLKILGGLIFGGTTAWTTVNLLIDQSPSLFESSTSSTEEPGMATVGVTMVSILSSSISGPDAVIELPGAVIEVFFKNQVPYAATEKRAEQVYEALHGASNYVPKKPILIAESQAAVEAASQAFCGVRGDGIMDNLELFEGLLKSVADKSCTN